jgi:hypothetical protein|tara:strand:+ start:77 stop:289 length:213 start_codon:yes stop_codon:yes gene_type:complete
VPTQIPKIVKNTMLNIESKIVLEKIPDKLVGNNGICNVKTILEPIITPEIIPIIPNNKNLTIITDVIDLV